MVPARLIAAAVVVLAACGDVTPPPATDLPPLSIDAQLPAAPTVAPATASVGAVRMRPVIQLTETLPPPPPVLEDGPPWARCPQWWSEARSVGWPEGELAHMDRIMYRESRCQPGAHNRAGANGLMQVMAMWADDCGLAVRQLLEAIPNLACALHVLGVQGWQAWAT